jgi:hypothetical protein
MMTQVMCVYISAAFYVHVRKWHTPQAGEGDHCCAINLPAPGMRRREWWNTIIAFSSPGRVPRWMNGPGRPAGLGLVARSLRQAQHHAPVHFMLLFAVLSQHHAPFARADPYERHLSPARNDSPAKCLLSRSLCFLSRRANRGNGSSEAPARIIWMHLSYVSSFSLYAVSSRPCAAVI